MEFVMDLKQMKKDFKTLNLVIIGLGGISEIENFLDKLRELFSAHLLNLNIAVYSDRILTLAEGQPERLKAKSRLTIPRLKSYFQKEYIGFINAPTSEKLYHHLYDSIEYQNAGFYRPPRYAHNSCVDLICKKFGKKDSDNETHFMLGDVTISFQAEVIEKGRAFARVEYHVIDSDEIRNGCLDWFDFVIKQLDIHCPNAFQSSYISSNYPQSSIVHERVYNCFDSVLLDRFILGAEWSVYFGKKILDSMDKSTIESLSALSAVHELKNGKIYRASSDITLFSDDSRKSISCVLDKMIIPGYGLHEWSELCYPNWTVSYLPHLIKVFFDPFSSNDPSLVFLHNFPIETVCEERMLKSSNLMDAFEL